MTQERVSAIKSLCNTLALYLKKKKKIKKEIRQLKGWLLSFLVFPVIDGEVNSPEAQECLFVRPVFLPQLLQFWSPGHLQET